MTNFDLFLDTDITRFESCGTYTKNDYTTVNVSFYSNKVDNQIIPESILNDFKHFVEKTIIEYVNDLNVQEQLSGNILNYIINHEELDTFIFKLNNYNS